MTFSKALCVKKQPQVSHPCNPDVFQPDRIKQFGAVNREYEGKRRRDVPYRPGHALDSLGGDSARKPPEERPAVGMEERLPPERPRVAFQSPPLVDYSTSLAQLAAARGSRVEPGGGMGAPINMEFHRNLSGTLGEMIAPRCVGIHSFSYFLYRFSLFIY